MRRRTGIGINRLPRCRKFRLGQRLRQRSLGTGNERRMEAARDRYPLRPHVRGLQLLGGDFEASLGSRDHRLMRRVVVGDPRLGVALQERFEDLRRRIESDHAARRADGGFLDCHAAAMRQADQVVLAQGPGGGEGDVFAVAVAGQEIRLDAERFQQPEHAETDRAEGRLGDLRACCSSLRFAASCSGVNGDGGKMNLPSGLSSASARAASARSNARALRGRPSPPGRACSDTAIPGRGTGRRPCPANASALRGEVDAARV